MKTVTIPKAEYNRLKKSDATDRKLVASIAKSLEDIKAGRVRSWD